MKNAPIDEPSSLRTPHSGAPMDGCPVAHGRRVAAETAAAAPAPVFPEAAPGGWWRFCAAAREEAVEQ